MFVSEVRPATLQATNPSPVGGYTLAELTAIAKDYRVVGDLPTSGHAEPYARTRLYRDDRVEVVCITFAKGQTSSVHDHQGSNCVVRLVEGEVLEFVFDQTAGRFSYGSHHYLKAGDVSGLDGDAVHQLSNVHPGRSVLLNFYSPPFKM